MADTPLDTARNRARSALDDYDALDREQRRDAGVLGEHAETMRSALDRLVETAGSTGIASDAESLDDRIGAARDTVQELDDAADLEDAQHVRRACYLLRRETKGLLQELDAVAA